MSPLSSGLAGQVGFVEESAYSTFVTPTRFAELVSESMQFNRDRIESQGIRAGRRVLHRWAQGVQRAAGDLVIEAAAQGQGLIWKHLLGGVNTSGAGPYCVDEETEILTAEGWKHHDTLRQGDEVLTLNHETGMSEWQPVLEVCVFPAERRELVLMEGRGHSSLTTPNHRWPVTAPLGRGGRLGERREWRTTETLRTHDRIQLAAQSADLPEEPKWSDGFVELVAWFITEGTIRPDSGAIKITKTLGRENGSHVARIDAALRNLFGPPTESLVGMADIPAWRRYTENGRTVRFVLSRAASALLTEVAPDRVPRRSYVRQLTKAQLELFIRTAMTDNAGPTRFVQQDKRIAEAFELAALLAGYGTSMLRRRHDTGESWIVTLPARRQGRGFIRRVEHDGIVWCPRTPNQTWLARRRGSVYFTGNTHTFTPGDLNGKSLTVQFGRPDEAGTVRPMTYLGTKITGAELAATVNEYAQLTLNLYAAHEDLGQALAVASYPAGLSPFTFVHGSLTVAAGAFDVADVSLTIDNGLATDRHRLRATTPERPKEPLMADRLAVTGTATVDFTDLTAYNHYVNGTEAAMVLDFNAGASARLTITMNVRFDGETPNIGGPELLTMDMPFKAVSATSDAAAITAVLINGDSAP